MRYPGRDDNQIAGPGGATGLQALAPADRGPAADHADDAFGGPLMRRCLTGAGRKFQAADPAFEGIETAYGVGYRWSGA